MFQKTESQTKKNANPRATRKAKDERDSDALTHEPLNQSLHAAKKAKQDEFYTRYVDIEREVEAYLEFDPDTFRDKVVYCNCDDPFESNFFKYFASNFNRLGLKKLISTSYDGSPIANDQLRLPEYTDGDDDRSRPKATAVVIDHVKDESGDGSVSIDDVKTFLELNEAARIPLKDDGKYLGGDFRNSDCVELLKQADIVATNPPFSLFREFVAQLIEHDKKFLIVGNKNAITYKEVFPLIKNNKMWVGAAPMGTDMLFNVPSQVEKDMLESGKQGSNYKIVDGRVMGRSSSAWFTNLTHRRRYREWPMMTMSDNLKHSKHKDLKGKRSYEKYDNYDAIEVPYVDAIPRDYKGIMGVPITFLDKFNPEQFEILGATESEGKGFSNGLWLEESGIAQALVGGKRVYKRVFIRHCSKKGKK